jgi:glycosyltransferase involved in cell wall biosynthesis
VNVAVNLLWMVPGGVGGSEEYVTRQLNALVDQHLDQLTLFTLPGFADAHPDLAMRCRVMTAPVSGRRRELRVAAELGWLTMQLRRVRFDLVHHAGGTIPLGSPGPTVLTIHDIQYLVYPDTFSSVKLAYLRRAVPAAVKRAVCIATPSAFVADTLAHAFGVPADRLVVVPNAIPVEGAEGTAPAALRATYDLPGPIVVYPAITYTHKNHATLLTAMAPLLREDASLRLVLLGGVGPCEAELQATAARLGINDQVIRPGRIPAADRDGLYAMASVMAFPSRYEGFGIPVLEAMAAGCPVVASNVTALPEAVGEAGILVDPDDVNAWTEALRRVLNDPAVSADLRARGYRRAAAFTAENTAAALHLAYTKAGEHR